MCNKHLISMLDIVCTVTHVSMNYVLGDITLVTMVNRKDIQYSWDCGQELHLECIRET